MIDGWSSRQLDLVLPTAVARAMWARARQWDADHGGRFEVGDDLLVLWSGTFSARPVTRVAAIAVRWNNPAQDTATIHRVAWNPRLVGEIEPWRALKVLAGRQWSVVFAAAVGRGRRAPSGAA
jgi:hypothetical protein